MIRSFPILAAALAFAIPASVPAYGRTPPPDESALVPLKVEQAAALRCSVAIALAAERQRMDQRDAQDWPVLAERGREFFVRNMARLMEETGLPRTAISLYARQEATQLQQPGRLSEVMPACLLMLDASGL